MSSKTLNIIGNGFDLYHGAESTYEHFRKYLLNYDKDVVKNFALYFGTKGLLRTFRDPMDMFHCIDKSDPIVIDSEWSKHELWCDFERNLCNLNREKILDVIEIILDAECKGKKVEDLTIYQQTYPIDMVLEDINSVSVGMRYRLHRWINTIHYKRGFRKKLLHLDKNAKFLNFNYTIFLETEYGIPHENICYIHGCRKDKIGSLIIGHGDDESDSLDRWIYKNKNRKRYRPNLMDKRGRYFANNKLAYQLYATEITEDCNYGRLYEEIEDYFSRSKKDVKAIIRSHEEWFDSLDDVSEINIYGHSLSKVDMPYFDKILNRIDKNSVRFNMSYHSDNDKVRIDRFCNRYGILADTFYM